MVEAGDHDIELMMRGVEEGGLVGGGLDAVDVVGAVGRLGQGAGADVVHSCGGDDENAGGGEVLSDHREG